jgi:outer membrane lipoprotein-sorting protein
MLRRSYRLAVAVALCAVPVAFSRPVAAQEKPPPPTEKPIPAPNPKIPAEVVKVLGDMVTAHKALERFSVTLDLRMKSPEGSMTAHSELSYAKPNRIAITAKRASKSPIGSRESSRTIVSDGKEIFGQDSSEPTQYRKTPALPGIENIGLGIRQSGGLYYPLFPLILTEADAKTGILPPVVDSAALQPDEKIDGVDVQVVKAQLPGPEGGKIILTFHIGKQDSLLRRLTVVTQQGEETTEIVESFTNIKANPTLSDAVFVYKPGPDRKLFTPPPKP